MPSSPADGGAGPPAPGPQDPLKISKPTPPPGGLPRRPAYPWRSWSVSRRSWRATPRLAVNFAGYFRTSDLSGHFDLYDLKERNYFAGDDLTQLVAKIPRRRAGRQGAVHLLGDLDDCRGRPTPQSFRPAARGALLPPRPVRVETG